MVFYSAKRRVSLTDRRAVQRCFESSHYHIITHTKVNLKEKNIISAAAQVFLAVSKKMPRNKWPKARWYPVRFSSALQTKYLLFSKVLRNLVSQRRLHMFCWPLESMWPGFSWKALRNVAGVRCWWSPVAGHQIIAFLLRRFCPCRRS